MLIRTLSSALITTLCVLSLTVQAQEPQDQRIYGGALFIPYVEVDSQRDGDSEFGLLGLLGIPLDYGFNIETSMSMYRYEGNQAPAAGTRDNNFYVFSGMIDLMYQYNFRRVKPFALVSAGWVMEDLAGSAGSELDPAVGLGLGAIVPIFKNGSGLRTEVRYLADGEVFGASSQRTDDIRFGIGAHIPYGIAAESTSAPTDKDADGIPDYRDRCPATPAGTQVDVWGCALDSDGDGVGDNVDQCPGTPSGQAVDSVGCEEGRDKDKDGVADDTDECPDTSSGLNVNSAGCAVKQTVVLEDVHFEFDSDKLTLNAQQIMDDISRTMKGQPSMEVEISGHTDSKGDAIYNQALSERRAAAVRDNLIKRGVGRSRLTALGYGQTRPIASGDSEEALAKNRRVEFKITKE